MTEEKHVVLLVEDDATIRDALASHLEDCGFTVLQVSNAVAALGFLMKPVCRVDLVFTDIVMPGNMDGLDLTKWVMQHRREIPVIVATGDAGRLAAVRELCKAEAIRKPFDHAHVTDKIRAAISSRPRQSTD